MKKKLLIPMVAVLAGTLTSCGSNPDVTQYMHTLTYHDNFRIFQISDLHMSSWDDLDEDLDYIKMLKEDALKKYGIDLMVVSGDLFTFASKGTIDYTLESLDSYNIPWTIVFGNHDEQLYADYNYISRKMATMKNGLYYHFDDNLTGISNNIINLVDPDDSNKIDFQVYAIDSNTYTYKNGVGYDYVHDDQIEWYKKGVEYASKKTYGDNWKVGDEAVKSVIFQHIPLQEFADAYEAYLKDPTIGTGVNDEGVSASPYNPGFFDVIKEYKSTKGMYVGHDHINCSDIYYEGIHLVYGSKSTDNIYHDEKMGYNMVTVNKDGTVSSDHVYKTYDGKDVNA